jgi:hypothetical protein
MYTHRMFVLTRCRGSAWWAPLLQTGIGAIIGAAGAITGGAFGSWFTWQKERQSVAAAFAAEVQGVIDLVEYHKIPEAILRGVKFPIEGANFPVFESNISKIGYYQPTSLPKWSDFTIPPQGCL